MRKSRAVVSQDHLDRGKCQQEAGKHRDSWRQTEKRQKKHEEAE
jgi:hypothetical protein